MRPPDGGRGWAVTSLVTIVKLAALAVVVAVTARAPLLGRIATLTERAEWAEARVAALQTSASHTQRQISALTDYGRQCEEARARGASDAAEAAEAAALRAGTGPAPTPQGGDRAAQGGHPSPRISARGNAPGGARAKGDADARRAYADLCNRPL